MHSSKIIQWLKKDHNRIEILHCVSKLNLPQCYAAAGFIRNLVWDELHNIEVPTLLNDIDVIYFDSAETDTDYYLHYEASLKKMMPLINWQVRNQAHMHIKNGDRPYESTVDAMSFWPEKETAVAARLSTAKKYECISAFGYESLFNLRITHNPKREIDIFTKRIATKGWLAIWSKLMIRT